MSNSENSFDPADTKTWHIGYQEVVGEPIIKKVFVGWHECWQCHSVADGVSAIGGTPCEAYHNWEARTISIERYFYG